MTMTTNNTQVSDPVTTAQAAGLNSVGMAPGADRLDLIAGLVEEAPMAGEEPEQPAAPAEGKNQTTNAGEESSVEETPAEPPAEEQSPEETSETEEQQETDPDVNGLQELPEKLKQQIAKRIGKEVGKRKELEERLQAAEAKLREVQESKPTAQEKPKSGNPLAQAETMEQLKAAISEMQASVDYADLALIRLEDDPVAVANELKEAGYAINEDSTPNQIKFVLTKLRNSANALLRGDQIDSAKEAVMTRQLARKQVESDFPWFRDHRSPEYVAFQNVLAANPGIKAMPDGELHAAIYVRGLAGYQAERAGKMKPAAKPVPKAQPTRPSAAPVRPAAKAPSAANFAEAQQAFLKTGNKEHRRQMVEMVADM
jgi:hypothetical protein